MSDKKEKVYAIIGGKRVCISDCDARVSLPAQQEKLKKILATKQKAYIVDKGIDATYIEVMEEERKAQGTQAQEPSVGPVYIGTAPIKAA